MNDGKFISDEKHEIAYAAKDFQCEKWLISLAKKEVGNRREDVEAYVKKWKEEHPEGEGNA